MLKIGVVGFGKSFLAWNLAGLLDAPLYADARAPYRRWNRTIRILETMEAAQGAPVLVMDHEENEAFPDLSFYAVPPDPSLVLDIQRAVAQAERPTHLVLNGYSKQATWGVFAPEFAPLAVIPWDMRQASAILLGSPLAVRDPGFAQHFAPLIEVIRRVAPR